MLLNKTTKMNSADRLLRRRTWICMKVKTWSRPWNPRCSCVTSLTSSKHKKVWETERNKLKRRSRLIGKRLRSRKCLNMTRRWKRSLSKNTTSGKRTQRTSATNLNNSNWIISNKSKRSYLKENLSRDKPKKILKGRNRRRLRDKSELHRSEQTYLKQTRISLSRSKLHWFKK